MNVAGAANRRCIAQLVRDRLDGIGEPRLCFACRIGSGARLEFADSQQCPRPSAKVLRGKTFARGLAKIGVDVGRRHQMPPAIIANVLKQYLPWEFLASAHDFCESSICQFQRMLDAAFADEFEADLLATHSHVAVA
jgi:hypothetical protein